MLLEPSHPVPYQVYEAAAACIDYGAQTLTKAIASANTLRAKLLNSSIRYIRKGVRLVERIETGALPQIGELQALALRQLARAFFEIALISNEEEERSNAFASAETTLDELVKLYRTSGAGALADAEELLLLRLEILQQRKASPRRLLEVLNSLFAQASISEEGFNWVFSLIRSHSDRSEVVGEVVTGLLSYLCRRRSEADTAEKAAKTLLAAFLACKAVSAVPMLNELLDGIAKADVELSQDGAFSVQMVCWRHGDGHHSRAHPDLLGAASFYRLAAHPAFRATANANVAKGARKAATCYLEAGQPQLALEALHSLCPAHLADDALNHYIRFTAFARLDREEEALQALQCLLGSTNFESSILPSVVQVAQEVGLQQVLYSAMKDIADRAPSDPKLAHDIDAVVLTRSLIKHHLPDDDNAASLDQESFSTLLQQFEHNLQALDKMAESNAMDVRGCKEAEWSYKTAYNTAVLLSQCETPAESTASMFDMALALARCRQKFLAQQVEADFHKTVVWCSLPSLVARAMLAREAKDPAEEEHQDQDQDQHRTRWTKIREQTVETWQLLEEARKSAVAGLSGEEAQGKAGQYLKEVEYALFIFEYESVVKLKDWTAARKLVETVMTKKTLPGKIREMIADLTWAEGDCPDDVLESALKGVVEAMRAGSL